MFGSSPGRGASLPMQHVLNGALHAAFHRAFPEEGSLPGEKIHSGRKVEGGFRFGNLSSLGPFLSEETTGGLVLSSSSRSISRDRINLAPTHGRRFHGVVSFFATGSSRCFSASAQQGGS